MAASEMHGRDRSNAVGDSRAIQKETRMEPKPMRNTGNSQADREGAERL
jgi:hypothetical protein